MTPEEFKNKFCEINKEAHKKRVKLSKEYCDSINPVKLGDIFVDHIGPIKVDKILNSVGNFNELPSPVYSGIVVRKDGKLSKAKTRRFAWFTNRKER